MSNYISEHKDKLFNDSLLDIIDDRTLSESTKIMKVRYLLIHNSKKTELEKKSIVPNEEELMFINNPKKLMFDEELIKGCDNSTKSQLYFERKFIYICKSHNASCTVFYFNGTGIYPSTILTNLTRTPPDSTTKSFLYQVIKLLSKGYSTITTYVNFQRYWRTEEEINKNTFDNLNEYAIIPLNILYHDLPFMKKYDHHLQTIHCRKQYKLQGYPNHCGFSDMLKYKLYEHIYSNELSYSQCIKKKKKQRYVEKRTI